MLSIKNIKKSVLSSLIKKFVMAFTGLLLASFLFGHMVGNLQMLQNGPKAINVYAHFLQTLPPAALWGFRVGLLGCLLLHLGMATMLWLENKKARPQSYAVKKSLVASPMARTMIFSGIVIIAFFFIHILQFTVKNLDPAIKNLEWVLDGHAMHDVYAMMIVSFSNPWVALAYIASMIIIGFHLSHGVSSMFQSVGLRNEAWRYRIAFIANVYCTIVAIGFILTPLSVLVCKYTSLNFVPVEEIVSQFDEQKASGKDVIVINYDFMKNKSE